MKKIKQSASRLKNLLTNDNVPKYINEITSCVSTKSFEPKLIVWNCLHSVAEHFANTGELDKQKAYDKLEEYKWEYTVIVEWEIIHLREWLLEECIEWIENWFENWKDVFRRWLAEWRVEDELFSWFIDLITDEWDIIDWKFVSNFNNDARYKTLEWYYVQWALYCRWYYNKYNKLPRSIQFIKILKANTRISSVWILSKEKICNMIEEQSWIDVSDERSNKDVKREHLLAKYAIYRPKNETMNIIPDDSLLQFWNNILDIAVKIRDKVYESMEVKERKDNSEWEELAIAIYDSSAISDYISFMVKKFQNTVDSFCKQYYEQVKQ